MAEESGNKISDTVTAQLVECVPEPPKLKLVLPKPPTEDCPVETIRDANIEQTGAEPPPEAK